MKKLLGCTILICFLSPAIAGDIYRWVDEKGRTQISDRVPAEYQARAKPVDTSKSKVSDAQQSEAHARLDKQKALLRTEDAIPANAPVPQVAAYPSQSIKIQSQRPVTNSDEPFVKVRLVSVNSRLKAA
jgi:hypothetical protein